MLEIVADFIRELFKCIKYSLEDITVFPVKNLKITLLFSMLIFICSFVSNAYGALSFISWQGALIALIILSVLALERGILDAKPEESISERDINVDIIGETFAERKESTNRKKHSQDSNIENFEDG